MKSKRVEKPKIVLDTNVVISALLSKDGNPAKIFELLLSEKIINFTSNDIINEIIKVYNREKIKELVTKEKISFIVNNFRKFSRIVIPNIKIDAIKDDQDDNKILECAVTAKADFIVSGDEHLTKLKKFKNIIILSPKAFLEYV